MTIIIGIDPGSRVTGYGVLEATGRAIRYLASGSIHAETGEMFERLHQIYSEVYRICQEFKPMTAGIEQIFMHGNPGSALKLGQARGAAMVAMTAAGLPMIAEYSARQVKLAVVGYGAAEKSQIAEMVKRLLNLSQNLQSDEADGLAIAYCHAQSRQGLGQLLNLKTTRGGRMVLKEVS